MTQLVVALVLAQCATGVNDGYQVLCGRKDFASSIAVSKGGDPNGVAAYVFDDVWLDGTIVAYPDGASIELRGRRAGADQGSEVNVRSTNHRDAGGLLSLHDYGGTPVTAIDLFGNVKLNTPTVKPCGLTGYSQFVDNTGIPNHVSMTSAPGQGLTLEGRYSDPEGGPATGKYSTNIDGGMWTDGGYLPFAANHGSLTISNSVWMEAGLMMDIRNKMSGNGALTDLVYFVDVQGGFGSLAQLRRADFGQCPGLAVMTNYGVQYAYGTRISTQLYAADEDRWYWCSRTGWRRMDGAP